jgi:hypothetical protein
MTPEAKAERVCELVRVYAHRRRHHIDHTGHTVRSLLDAVGALLGKPVTFADEAHRSTPERRKG